MATRIPHWRGIALTAAAAVAWSSGGILVRLMEAGPWEIVFWRSVFMALTLLGYLAVVTRGAVAAEFRAVGWPGVASGLLLAATFVFYITALAHTSVANTVVIMSAGPLFSALLGRLVLGEAVARRTWAVMAVALGGIVLMFVDSLGSGAIVGDLLALGVAACFGSNTVLLRASRGVNMVPAVCLAGVFSAVATWPLAAPGAVTFRDLGLLALMGAGQLGLGLVLFVHGVRHLPAAEVGLLTLLETVLAPVWAWLGVGERPAPLALAGGTVVVGALGVHSALGPRRSKPPAGMA